MANTKRGRSCQKGRSQTLLHREMWIFVSSAWIFHGPAGCQPSYSVEVLECVCELRGGGRGERTQRSRIRLPEDIDCGLIARLTSVSVHCGPWCSSRSYFRGRIRAEMTRNHPEPCSCAPKAPKIHMTNAFQETTPNMMTFAIKWSEREMRSPLLHSKQWTALQVKGADSVGWISSIGRIKFKRSWAQRLLGNDEAGSCVCWSVTLSQYCRLMELLLGLSGGVHKYRHVFKGCWTRFWDMRADMLVQAVCKWFNNGFVFATL